MSMRDTLNYIVQNVDGALLAVVMAYDGIAIDEAAVEQSEFDTQLLSVEYANVLKEIKRAVEVIRAGELEEVSIVTRETSVLMRTLNEELFIALIIKGDGNSGKGRFLLKTRSSHLIQELG